MMGPKTDKLVKRTTIVATVTASYLLLTADYGPEPNILDPSIMGIVLGSGKSNDTVEVIKKAIQSAENRAKEFVLGPSNKPQESQMRNVGSDNSKEQP